MTYPGLDISANNESSDSLKLNNNSQYEIRILKQDLGEQKTITLNRNLIACFKEIKRMLFFIQVFMKIKALIKNVCNLITRFVDT